MKVLFLCSGGGSTAKFLRKLSKANNCIKGLDIEIISDRKCGAYEWGMNNNISTKLIDMNAKGKVIAEDLNTHRADIIVTTIYKILSKEIIKEIDSELINIHYSILPSFKGSIGKKTVQNAIDYGCAILGATCHSVSEEVDSGTPISQVAITKEDEEFSSTLNKIFRCGCLALYSVLLKKLKEANELKNILEIDKVKYLCSPGIVEIDAMDNPDFWMLDKQ